MARFPIYTLLLALLWPLLATAKPAPDFSLEDESGRVYAREDFAGHPLVLYFLSFSCSRCNNIRPLVNEIAGQADGRYAVLGVVFGTKKEDLAAAKQKAGDKFPVAAGTRAVIKSYVVPGTPYFWLLDANGGMEERFSGELGAAALQKYLRSCTGNVKKCTDERVGLYEIAEEPKRFAGKEIVTGGILAPGGNTYFPSPRFLLTNGTDKIQVSPWLPIEVAPGPPGFKKRPRPTMAEVLGKYAVVTGVVREGKEGLYIEVKQATASD